MRFSVCLLMAVFAILAVGCGESNDKPVNPAPAGGAPGGGAPAANAKATDLKPAPAGALPIGPDKSSIEFTGTKPGGKHDGKFQTFSGGVELAGDDVTKAKISVEIDAASLKTDNGMLDNHLKNADFFDVTTHPKASFTSTKIEAKVDGANTHVVTGDLTLHGVTKSISFPAEIKLSKESFELSAQIEVNRMDYGMTTVDASKVDEVVKVRIKVDSPRA